MERNLTDYSLFVQKKQFNPSYCALSVTCIGDVAFAVCMSLTDVYCYAENVPSTDYYAFEYSPISRATLHVPAASVSAYKAASPWNKFGSIVAIE